MSAQVAQQPVAVSIARKRRWLFWTSLISAVSLLLLLVVTVVGGVWLLRSVGGQQQLLSWLPKLSSDAVQIIEPSGDLRDKFSAKQVRIHTRNADVVIDGLRYELRDYEVRPALFHFTTLVADVVTVTTRPSDEPTVAPENLKLPFVLRVDAFELGKLVVRAENLAADKAGTVVQNIRGQLALDNDKHTIKLNGAILDTLQITGDVEVGAAAPMPLKAQIEARELGVVARNRGALEAFSRKREKVPDRADEGGELRQGQRLAAPIVPTPPTLPPSSPALLPPAGEGSQTASIKHAFREGDVGLQWTAKANLSGTLAEMKLDGAVIAADQTLTAQATVRPFAAVPVTTLNAAFERFDLRKLQASLPQTLLTGKAVIALDKAPLQIDIQAVNALPGSIDSGRLPVAELTVRANGVVNQPKQWTINAFNARLQGRTAAGAIAGSGEWKDGPWAINFDARGVRLQELQTTLPALELKGDVRAAGRGIDVAKQPVALKVRLNGTALGDVRSIPVALRKGFVGELDAQLLSEKIDLKQLKLSVGETQLTATSKAQLQGSTGNKTWQIDGDAQWSGFDPFLWSKVASTQSAQLNGSLKATATLPANAMQKVQALNVQAQLLDSRWAGQALVGKFDARLLDALTTTGTLPRIESNGQARLGGNNVNWSGRVGAVSDVLQWKLDAPALNELLASAKVESAALQGRINAEGQVTGGWKTPAIKANFEGVDVVASGTAVAVVKGSVQAALQADAPLVLDVSAQRVRPNRAAPVAVGNAPPPEIDLMLQGRGTLASHRVTTQATLRQKSRKFVLDTALTGALSFDRAGVPTGWLATVQPLNVDEEVATTVAASGKQNWISASTLALRWQRGTDGALGQAQTFSMEPGSATVAGVTLAWDRARYAKSSARGGPPQLDFSGRIESLSVAELARRLGTQGDNNVSGDLQMQGQFKASGVPGAPGFAVQVELARVGGDLRAGESESALLLGLRELSLRLKADADQWQMAFLSEGQRLGRAEANASVRTADTGGVPGAASVLSGNVLARMDDLSVWNSLLPTGWRAGGGINGGASLGGTLGEPKVSGALTLANASLRNPVDGVDITRGQGRLAFDGSTLRLENVSAQAGKGNVRVNGQGPVDGRTPFMISAAFEQFAVLTRVDRRVDISGQADLSLAAKQVLINGKLTVDRGLIDITQLGAPTLSDDVVVVRKSDAQRPVAANTAPKVAMSLVVDLGKELRLIGRGIETRLAGDLTLSTPGGVLTAIGSIRAEDGRYEAYGQKLNVERSTVRFVGPLNNPVLDILALRPNRDNDDRVGVSITGTALQPRIKLYAVPERSDTDKLAMLVLGRNFDELGRDETALIQTAALALLSGERGGSVSSKLGLDTLSVRQASGAGGSTKDVVITVGKQISDKVYVGYEQGLAGGAGTVQLIYRISQRLTLRAQAGKEDSSLDAILTFRWR